MKYLTVVQLRAAWWKPLPHEDPGEDFARRLEAVQEAVLAAQVQMPLPEPEKETP